MKKASPGEPEVLVQRVLSTEEWKHRGRAGVDVPNLSNQRWILGVKP